MGKRMLITGLAVLSLAASGCGSDDSTETASEPLSPTAFVAEGKKVCENARLNLQKAVVGYQRKNGVLNPRDVGVKAVAVTLLPVQRQELEELEALVPPKEVAERYEAFLKARSETLDEIESNGLSSNAELLDAFERSDKMAVALQIEACSFA